MQGALPVQVALANLDAVLQEARGALEALPPHLLAELQAVQQRLHPRPCSAGASSALIGTNMPLRCYGPGIQLDAASQLCATHCEGGEEVARTRQVSAGVGCEGRSTSHCPILGSHGKLSRGCSGAIAGAHPAQEAAANRGAGGGGGAECTAACQGGRTAGIGVCAGGIGGRRAPGRRAGPRGRAAR